MLGEKVSDMNKSKIKFFDVGNGDSAIIELYVKDIDETINILFDMGNKKEEVMDYIKDKNKIIHGIVVTHVDSDHICGIKKLLANNTFYNTYNKLKFIVFNDFNNSLISYAQGDKLMQLIESKYKNIKVINSYEKDYTDVNSDLDIPIKFLSIEKRDLYADLVSKTNDIFVTFLAPAQDDLKRLMTEWEKYRIKKNKGEESNARTVEITNKSSIVCLIEYGEICILMTGDQEINSIKPILMDKKELWNVKRINCIKISHHASKENNIGLEEIINEFKCKKAFYMKYMSNATKKNIADQELLDNLKNMEGMKIYTDRNDEIDLEELDE